MSSKSDSFKYEYRQIDFDVVGKNEKEIPKKEGVEVDIEFTCFTRLFLRIPELEFKHQYHGCSHVASVDLGEKVNSVTIKPHQLSNCRKFGIILLNQVIIPNWPLQTRWYLIFVKKFWYKLKAIVNRMSPNHNLLSLKVNVDVFGTHYLVKSSVFHHIMEESIRDAGGVLPAHPLFVKQLPRKRIQNVEEEEEKGGCSICLEEFSEGCQVANVRCGHMFHTKCIERWFCKSCYCPLCRWKMPLLFNFSDKPLLGIPPS